MHKRILMIALTLLLLMGASACGEEAYDQIGDAMYRIVLRDGETDVTLGSGVLFADQQTLLTALACCQEGELFALGSDGEHPVLRYDAAEGAGAALMTLATPSAAKPLVFAENGTNTMPLLFGTNAEGSMGTVPLYMVRHGLINGFDALMLSSEEGLLPGAFIADSEGKVTGLVIVQHMEGFGTYIGVDASVLGRAMAPAKEESPFLPATLLWENGLMTISWQDAERTNGQYIITISGEGNRYYSDYTQEIAQRSVGLALPPGHTYYTQVQWVADNADGIPPVEDDMMVFTLPETTFTAFGFTQQCYLAGAPAGKATETVLPEMTKPTAEILTDPAKDIYLQIRSAYANIAQDEMTMTLELIAPDGQFYFEEMGFVFVPEYAQDDSFAVPLDDLIADCVQFSGGALKPGKYLVRYAINGQVAGECAFTLD